MRAQTKKRPMHLRAVEPDTVRAARLANLSDLLAERLSSHPAPSPVISAEPGHAWRTLRQLGAVAVLAGIGAAVVMALPLLPGEPSGMRALERAAASAAEAPTPSPAVAAIAAPITETQPASPREPQVVTAIPSVPTTLPAVLQAGLAVEPAKPAPAERELTWEEVHELQRRLQALSFEPGPLDGLKGPMTSAAVRRFEKARGLPETGEVNLTTLSRVR